MMEHEVAIRLISFILIFILVILEKNYLAEIK